MNNLSEERIEEFREHANSLNPASLAFQSFHACLNEIESLQAEVDKFPKTADDVPVVPGMKVYRFDPAGYLQGYDVGTNKASDDSSLPSPVYLMFNHNCYSTEAAARAGAEKKQ